MRPPSGERHAGPVDGGWLKALFPDAVRELQRQGGLGLQPQRTRSPQRRPRMTDLFAEKRQATEQLRRDFIEGRLLLSEEAEVPAEDPTAVALGRVSPKRLVQSPGGSPRSPRQSAERAPLASEEGDAVITNQAASQQHTKELLQRARDVNTAVQGSLAERKQVAEWSRDAPVSCCVVPDDTAARAKHSQVHAFQSKLPLLQRVLSDDEPLTPRTAKRLQRGSIASDSNQLSERGSFAMPDAAAAAAAALQGSPGDAAALEAQLEATWKMRLEKAVAEAAEKGRQEARDGALQDARKEVLREQNQLHQQIRELDDQLRVKQQQIREKQCIIQHLGGKIMCLREDLYPLQEKERKMNLVDVDQLQAEIAFFEQERAYLYTKIFRLDLTWAAPPVSKGGGSDGPKFDKTFNFDKALGGQMMNMMADRSQGDKLLRRLADRTRSLTLKLLKSRDLMQGIEMNEMQRHDRDCYFDELRSQARTRGGERQTKRYEEATAVNEDLREHLSGCEKRLWDTAAREDQMRQRRQPAARFQMPSWDDVADNKLADRVLLLSGWDETKHPEARSHVLNWLRQAFYSQARVDAVRLRLQQALLAHVPNSRLIREEVLGHLTEACERIKVERFETSSAYIEHVKALLHALNDAAASEEPEAASQVQTAASEDFADQRDALLGLWQSEDILRSHTLRALSGDQLREANEAREELLQLMHDKASLLGPSGLRAAVTWLTMVATDDALGRAAPRTSVMPGTPAAAAAAVRQPSGHFKPALDLLPRQPTEKQIIAAGGSAIVDPQGRVIGHAGKQVAATEMTLVTDQDGYIKGRVGNDGEVVDLEGQSIPRSDAMRLFPGGVYLHRTARKIGDVDTERENCWLRGPDGKVLNQHAVHVVSGLLGPPPKASAERAAREREEREAELRAEEEARRLDEELRQLEEHMRQSKKSLSVDGDDDYDLEDGAGTPSRLRSATMAGQRGSSKHTSGKPGNKAVAKLKGMLLVAKEEANLKMGKLEQRILGLHHLLFRFLNKLKAELDIPEDYIRTDPKKIREEVEKHMRGLEAGDMRMERSFQLFSQDCHLISCYLNVISGGAKTGREQQAMGAMRAGIFKLQHDKDFEATGSRSVVATPLTTAGPSPFANATPQDGRPRSRTNILRRSETEIGPDDDPTHTPLHSVPPTPSGLAHDGYGRRRVSDAPSGRTAAGMVQRSLESLARAMECEHPSNPAQWLRQLRANGSAVEALCEGRLLQSDDHRTRGSMSRPVSKGRSQPSGADWEENTPLFSDHASQSAHLHGSLHGTGPRRRLSEGRARSPSGSERPGSDPVEQFDALLHRRPSLEPVLAFRLVGQPAMQLHELLLRFVELVKKRLNLRHAKGVDPIQELINASPRRRSSLGCPDVRRLIDSDVTLLTAFNSLLEVDDADGSTKTRMVFKKMGALVRMSRLQSLKNSVPADGPPKLENFLERQEARMLENVKRLEEKKQALQEERNRRWAKFTQPHQEVPMVPSEDMGVGADPDRAGRKLGLSSMAHAIQRMMDTHTRSTAAHGSGLLAALQRAKTQTASPPLSMSPPPGGGAALPYSPPLGGGAYSPSPGGADAPAAAAAAEHSPASGPSAGLKAALGQALGLGSPAQRLPGTGFADAQLGPTVGSAEARLHQQASGTSGHEAYAAAGAPPQRPPLTFADAVEATPIAGQRGPRAAWDTQQSAGSPRGSPTPEPPPQARPRARSSLALGGAALGMPAQRMGQESPRAAGRGRAAFAAAMGLAGAGRGAPGLSAAAGLANLMTGGGLRSGGLLPAVAGPRRTPDPRPGRPGAPQALPGLNPVQNAAAALNKMRLGPGALHGAPAALSVPASAVNTQSQSDPRSMRAPRKLF